MSQRNLPATSVSKTIMNVHIVQAEFIGMLLSPSSEEGKNHGPIKHLHLEKDLGDITVMSTLSLTLC